VSAAQPSTGTVAATEQGFAWRRADPSGVPARGGAAARELDRIIADTRAVALVMRETLMPVAGDGSVIFPPLFANGDYCESRLPDGRSMFVIDTIAAQCNRIEAQLDGEEPFRDLIPKVRISAVVAVADGTGSKSFRNRSISVNRLPHRLADALVRYSELSDEARRAFFAFSADYALPIAQLAPLTLVFGAWDAHGTKVRIPRVLRARIDAVDAARINRAGYFRPSIDCSEAGMSDCRADRLHDLGFAPAAHSGPGAGRGGIVCRGPIVRELVLNLTAVRGNARGVGGGDALRRYVFGLALCGFLAPLDTFLRQDCQLVLDKAVPVERLIRTRDGGAEDFPFTLADAVDYTARARDALGIDVQTVREARFESTRARHAVESSTDARVVAPRPVKPLGAAAMFSLAGDADSGTAGGSSTPV